MMEATLLTKEQVLGDKKLSIFEKINAKCAITDFAIVLDSYVSDRYVDYDNTLKGRTDWYYLLDPCIIAKVQCVDPNGSNGKIPAAARDGGVRPVLPLSNTFLNNIKENNGLTEVEYGEYPQYVVSTSMENELDQAYRKNMKNMNIMVKDILEYVIIIQININFPMEKNMKKKIMFG